MSGSVQEKSVVQSVERSKVDFLKVEIEELTRLLLENKRLREQVTALQERMTEMVGELRRCRSDERRLQIVQRIAMTGDSCADIDWASAISAAMRELVDTLGEPPGNFAK